MNQETLSKAQQLCHEAGCKARFAMDRGLDQKTLYVALGREWMEAATDSGTRYDKLIEDLNAMSTKDHPVEVCGAISGYIDFIY